MVDDEVGEDRTLLVGNPAEPLTCFAILACTGSAIQVAGLARRMVTLRNGRCGGSWNGSPGNPSVVTAVSAIFRAVGAASGHGVWGRTSHNPSAVGSSPTRPT